MKKAELEQELENELILNPDKYSVDSQLAGFYGYNAKKRSEGSPVKKESSSGLELVETKAKGFKRRVTKAAEDFLTT